MTGLRWVLGGLALCASIGAQALQITEVLPSTQRIDPAKGERWEVGFRIDEAAKVRLKLYDGREVLVRTLEADAAAGPVTLQWDGLDAGGHSLPAEAYHYVIEAQPGEGESVVYDLTDVTGGQRIGAEALSWDADAGVVRFRLGQPTRINIRTGLGRIGPLLRTVVDWVPRPAGDQAIPWDGQDASGVLDLSRHPELDIAVEAYSLPDNVIFVGSPPQAVTFSERLDTTVRRTPTQVGPKRMYFHAQQPLEARGDIAIHISVNGAPQPKGAEPPEVSGLVIFTLDVDDKDRQRVLDRRFEPVFFVDGSFVFENEVGFLPTSWIMDTSRYPEGEHFVTANLRGYEGNFGIATVRIRIKHGDQ